MTDDDLALYADCLEELNRLILQRAALLVGIAQHFHDIDLEHAALLTERDALLADIARYLA